MHDSKVEQAQAIQAILSQGWIKAADWQDEVDSTNRYASAAIEAGENGRQVKCELPAIWVADRQTAGRGRSDHSWWSPAGCLMLTIGLNARGWTREGHEISQLALVAGVATAMSLEQFVSPGTQVQLKWPNDAYIREKKCGGILIESGPDGSWLVGIGLNVNVDLEAAPIDVRKNATSLHLHAASGGQQLTTALVLVELVEQLEHWIEDWSRGSAAWFAEWHEHCMLSGRVVHAQAPNGKQKVGRCEGIDSSGRLLIRDELSVVEFGSGEILAWQ